MRRKAMISAAQRFANAVADKAAAMPETAAQKFIREEEAKAKVKFAGTSAAGLSGAKGVSLPPGVMNVTEEAYLTEVLEAAINDGLILWYKFESVKLRIEENCFYTADFMVMTSDGFLYLVDVKALRSDGTIQKEDDSLVKMRAVAALYPFGVLMAAGRKEKGSWVWREEWIKPIPNMV